MMRDPALQTFIEACATAIAAHPAAPEPIGRLAEHVFGACHDHVGTQHLGTHEAQPVCRHLAPALAAASSGSRETAAVATAFSTLASRLSWRERIAGPDEPAGFRGNHANALLIGLGGLEDRGDIRIGASLVAPHTTYPDHDHPPEEMYLALSQSEWRNAETPWHAPGIGGIVHNPPGIRHAMRAGETPLFAIWCLWQGDDA